MGNLYKVPGLKTPKHIKQKRKSPVAGVRIGGKKITSFSQIKTKSAGKIGAGERTRRGIGLAIL